MKRKKIVQIMIGGALALGGAVQAADIPQWWYSRGLLNPQSVANDYAPANIGQLKQVAYQTWVEMTNVVANPRYTAQDSATITNSYAPDGTFKVTTDGKLMLKFGANWFVFTPEITLNAPPPAGMSLIPAGSFVMGDTFSEGSSDERPLHTVNVSAFYMDQTEVTKAQWAEVYTWAVANGYSFYLNGGETSEAYAQSWYDCVKWANARSEKEGLTACYTVSGNIYRTGESAPDCNWSANGYRLPTEAEWEKAARGGAAGHRFPWSDSDTIQHARANYYATTNYAYDTNPPQQEYRHDTPVGAFAPNGYGLYDMAGNLDEWCWDWYEAAYYSSSSGTDPRGPGAGLDRVTRGGELYSSAYGCRVACRNYAPPGVTLYGFAGFRLARRAQ